MNVYVIYKFDDRDRVLSKIRDIQKEVGGLYFFLFPDRSIKHWHRYAKKKMKDSHMVAFFDNLDGNENNLKHIKWELSLAERMKKRIFVFKEENQSFEPRIYGNDYSESAINRYRYKVISLSRAAEFFKNETTWSVDSHLMHADPNATENGNSDSYNEILLEQYRIMIDTSERLMERRQSTGNLYTTICAALIAFVGATFGFSNSWITASSALLSGIIITVLCINWRASLSAYELNNGGKFAVINKIEKLLPADMFECEYRYNTLNGIRSYSSREKRLPAIFMFFGIALIVISAVLFALNFI